MPNYALDTALPVGSDWQRYARVLARTREAMLSGQRPHVLPRSVIGDSWSRAQRLGVPPDHGCGDEPISATELEDRRAECGLTGRALSALRDALVTVAEDGDHIMVVADAEGRVLWREGHSAVCRQADGIGFMAGARWTESSVGTNAIGTALVAGRPVQVHATEHFVRSHHPWTCAAAPIHDPRDGDLLGAVDVSGPADTVHPSTLALARASAELAQEQLRQDHRQQLERLRAVASPILSRLSGQAVAVDRNGWVAASVGVPPSDRIALPERCVADHVRLDGFGYCSLEPIPEGTLIRAVEPEAAPATSRVELDVRLPGSESLTIRCSSGAFTYRLSRRHAQILLLLARHPEGRTAAQLSGLLFDDPTRTVTVRAEISRLRRNFGDLLEHRPYRFVPALDVAVQYPDTGQSEEAGGCAGR